MVFFYWFCACLPVFSACLSQQLPPSQSSERMPVCLFDAVCQHSGAAESSRNMGLLALQTPEHHPSRTDNLCLWFFFRLLCAFYPSDILFPYRSPSPRPHPDPSQHPETDPKRSRNGAETEPKRSQTEPKWTEIKFFAVGRVGGLSGYGVRGGCKGKRNSL